tara:strand:+ start:419 stop:739 length:321 start_codon:yes stop_codon:yes gene_type:complete
MNTQLAFAFGMLAMVAITMLVVLVVGMVKVIKLQKQANDLELSLAQETEMIHRHMSDNERAIYSEINEVRKNFHQYSDQLKRELTAYTDSRVDKTLGTKEKQLLKN